MKFSFIGSVFCICQCLFPSFLHAQVVLDGSLGGSSGQVVSAGGGVDYLIAEELGTLRNSNLFYSFNQFDIQQNETGLITGNSPVQNILARVTGGSASNIDGALTSDFAGANVWFFNTAGVVIGDTAQINVQGSFSTSTANTVAFDDGVVWVTNTPNTPVLSVGVPESFGFLAGDQAAIIISDADFSLTAGSRLSATAHTLSVNNLDISGSDLSLSLVAPNQNNMITLDESTVSSDFSPNSNITISNSSVTLITANADSFTAVADSVTIDSSRLTVASTNVEQHTNLLVAANNIDVTATQSGSRVTLTTAAANAKGVNLVLAANETLLVEGAGTRLTTTASDGIGNAEAGDMTINAGQIILRNGGRLTASVSGDNLLAGDVDISASSSIQLDDASISAEVLATAQGGQFELTAPTIELVNQSVINNDNLGSGETQQLVVNAVDLIVNTDSSITSENGDGISGGIAIDAKTINLSQSGFISTQAFGVVEGGDIIINVGDLVLTDGGRVTASALDEGAGGDLTINALRSVLIDGTGSTEETTGLFARTGDLNFAARFIFPGFGVGDGGTINLQADNIAVRNGGVISTSATQGLFAPSVGNAGSIFIQSNRLNVNKASIQTSAPDSAGGNIDIRVRDFIGIVDSAVTASAGGVSPTDSGGNIFIDPELLFFNRANITANANAGNGGNITIIANNIVRDPTTVINASSQAGVDGDVQINGVINEVGSLDTLEVEFDDVAKILAQRCNIAALTDRSSFVVQGADPGTANTGDYSLAPLLVAGNGLDISANSEGYLSLYQPASGCNAYLLN